MIGASPNTPGLFHVFGFSGHGFKFAAVLGEIAADLALTGATTQPIGLFALDRFAAPPLSSSPARPS